MVPLYERSARFEHYGLKLSSHRCRNAWKRSKSWVRWQYDGALAGDDRYTPAPWRPAPAPQVISKWGTGIDSIDRRPAPAWGSELGVQLTLSPAGCRYGDGYMLPSLAANLDGPFMKAGIWEKLPGVPD